MAAGCGKEVKNFPRSIDPCIQPQTEAPPILANPGGVPRNTKTLQQFRERVI